jgi:hypothetical protein
MSPEPPREVLGERPPRDSPKPVERRRPRAHAQDVVDLEALVAAPSGRAVSFPTARKGGTAGGYAWLAIPPKRCERAVVEYLTGRVRRAAGRTRSTWLGRRDHALLTLAVQTGLRAA